MKRIALTFLSAFLLTSTMTACSNWNRMTPKSADGTTIEAEIRKNLAGDHITGLTVDVNDGVVTLGGHLNRADRETAVHDAEKVAGVKRVINNLTAD